MGLRVALGEMFPLTAMCPRMWSSLVLLVYLVQLVRNTSSSYSKYYYIYLNCILDVVNTVEYILLEDAHRMHS